MNQILTTEHHGDHEVHFKISSPFPAAQSGRYDNREAAGDDALARSLFLVMGIRSVQLEADTITIERDPEVIWPLIIPPAVNIISSKIKNLCPNSSPGASAPSEREGEAPAALPTGGGDASPYK